MRQVLGLSPSSNDRQWQHVPAGGGVAFSANPAPILIFVEFLFTTMVYVDLLKSFLSFATLAIPGIPEALLSGFVAIQQQTGNTGSGGG